MTGKWRCLFWVQSLLGSGHLRRALLLAEAIAAQGAQVILANGGPPGPWTAPPGVRLVQLPPISARDGNFAELCGPSGLPADAALWRRRADLLQGLAREQPELLITEMFPFGRRAFRDELIPLLDTAPTDRLRPVIVSSVRDVLVSKRDPSRYDWMISLCRDRYDLLLVHGDPRLMPFASSFPRAHELGQLVEHTGFIFSRPKATEDAAQPALLVSAGGGAVGERLLAAALAARPLSQFRHAQWLLVGGHNLPPGAFERLSGSLSHGCVLERYRPDLASLMGVCEVSVSQAGYNTVVEGLALGARMVLVPFADGEEDEQEQRARRLEALGMAERVGETEVDGAVLAAAIDRVGGRARPDPSLFSFDGAARSAAIVAARVRERFGAA